MIDSIENTHDVCISISDVHALGTIFIRVKNRLFIYYLNSNLTMLGDLKKQFIKACDKHGFENNRSKNYDVWLKYYTTEEKFRVFQDELTEKNVFAISQFDLDGDFSVSEDKLKGIYLPSKCSNFKAISCCIEGLGSSIRIEYRFFTLRLGIYLSIVLYARNINREAAGQKTDIEFEDTWVNAFDFDAVCRVICKRSLDQTFAIDEILKFSDDFEARRDDSGIPFAIGEILKFNNGF